MTTENENKNNGSSDERELPNGLRHMTLTPEEIQTLIEETVQVRVSELMNAYERERQQRVFPEQQVTPGRLVHYWDDEGPYDRDEENRRIYTPKPAIVASVHFVTLKGKDLLPGSEELDLHVFYGARKGMWQKIRVPRTHQKEHGHWDWPARS